MSLEIKLYVNADGSVILKVSETMQPTESWTSKTYVLAGKFEIKEVVSPVDQLNE